MPTQSKKQDLISVIQKAEKEKEDSLDKAKKAAEELLQGFDEDRFIEIKLEEMKKKGESLVKKSIEEAEGQTTKVAESVKKDEHAIKALSDKNLSKSVDFILSKLKSNS